MKHFKFCCIALVVLFSSSSAHAGTLTGYIIGASSANSAIPPQSTVLVSDTHDVIVCCEAPVFFGPTHKSMCNASDRFRDAAITPTQHAQQVGYKTVYKVGFVDTARGCNLIIMEVGK